MFNVVFNVFVSVLYCMSLMLVFLFIFGEFLVLGKSTRLNFIVVVSAMRRSVCIIGCNLLFKLILLKKYIFGGSGFLMKLFVIVSVMVIFVDGFLSFILFTMLMKTSCFCRRRSRMNFVSMVSKSCMCLNCRLMVV